MMYCKIGICDDRSEDLQLVRSIVLEWAERTEREVDVEVFGSAEEFLFHYEHEGEYDVLLLDIEMSKMDGVTLAKRVRASDKEVQIVFITGYTEYIAEGYEVEALHYLVKPIYPEKLFAILERAVEKRVRFSRTLSLEANGERLQIPLYEILYVDVDRNHLTIHTKKDHFSIRRTLTSLEAELGEGFHRVGRAYIVGLRHVRRATKKEVQLTDGIVLPLPRGAYEDLNRAIIACE